MLSYVFKSIIRSFRRNRVFSVLNVFGLAIGMTCAGLIFLWAENELSYDSHNIKEHQLHAILTNQKIGDHIFSNWSAPRELAASVKKNIPGVVNTCRISDGSINALFSTGKTAVHLPGRFTDSTLFSMFTLPFTEGDRAGVFSNLNSIVLTERSAKEIFGTASNVLGKTVRMDNEQPYIVSGVLEDLPENSTLQFEWLAPYVSHEAPSWGSYGPFTYVELAPSANIAKVNSLLYNYIHERDKTQTGHSFLFPMRDWHLRGEFVNGRQTGAGQITQVRLLLGVAWIILLIACINFMNLTTAKSEKLARDIGVRKVLGSDKTRLVVQFMAETFALSFLAGLIAVVFIELVLPLFNQLVHKDLHPTLTLVHVSGFIALLSISALLAGSYPSFYLSSFKPVSVLSGLKIKTGSAAVVRKSLVVIQFSVSIFFIIGTTVIFLQILHAKSRNLGFDKSDLIEFNMQHAIAENFSVIRNDLLNTGFVSNVAAADQVILDAGNTDDRFTWPGKSNEEGTDISFRKVSPEFISTYGMKLVSGRDFDQSGTAAGSNTIVTKSLAKIIGGDNVVGKIIQSPRDQPDGHFENLTIIGVVDDYVFGNVYDSPGPVLFLCRPGGDESRVYVRLKPSTNLNNALTGIEAVLKKDNPGFPMQYTFVDDQFNRLSASETNMSKIAGVFAVIAIIISCLGLFGLAAHTAGQKIKEIGIRKVLGGTVANLVVLLSKDFVMLVGISCLLAFPVAGWIMSDWLRNFPYRINLSWWIFGIAGLGAILIAVLTISFETIRAATANPIKSLRTL